MLACDCLDEFISRNHPATFSDRSVVLLCLCSGPPETPTRLRQGVYHSIASLLQGKVDGVPGQILRIM